jgi:beta-lactamase class A
MPHTKQIPSSGGFLRKALIVVLLVAGTVIVCRYMVGGDALELSCEQKFTYVNPRFACGSKVVVSKAGYAVLRANIRAYIEEQEKAGKAIEVGMWFRDLESGPTFGVNDRMDFIPASLLKLPLVLTLLQLAEDDPSFLEQVVVYTGLETPTPNQVFSPHEKLEKDAAYTIDSLIYRSIVYSDNVSAQLLYDYLRRSSQVELLSQTYRDLGILEPDSDLNRAVVNTKGYGSIFRMIYNSSFLNAQMSEKLLALLAQAEFPEGLQGGIPEGVKIAHKFGERFLPNGERQLHDCGIVYYPQNPYQLCVMSKGANFDDLKIVIQDISRMVYREFDGRKIEK